MEIIWQIKLHINFQFQLLKIYFIKNQKNFTLLKFNNNLFILLRMIYNRLDIKFNLILMIKLKKLYNLIILQIWLECLMK